jgi:hypothetical protein
VTKTVTVYHDDPKVVEMEKVRQSACITVDEDVKPEGEFGKMHVPGGLHSNIQIHPSNSTPEPVPESRVLLELPVPDQTPGFHPQPAPVVRVQVGIPP